MIVKTRNGVFSNQGYGGGSFNKNTAFGAVGSTAERQHRYGDMSNLNAPYDNISLQGLSGLGSLSGTSLGLDASAASAIMSSADSPWLVYSEATKAIQQDLNPSLVRDGFIKLVEDGKLGPRTCGALNHYGRMGEAPACAGHDLIAPERYSPSPSPSLSPVPVVPEKKGMSPWVWGILLGVGAVAAVTYMKKRKGRSVTLSTTYG